MSSPTCRLNELKNNQSGVIETVDGDDVVASRLMEMGLTEGERITLIGRAPMGDPIEFAIRGYRISLRTSEAMRIVVSLP